MEAFNFGSFLSPIEQIWLGASFWICLIWDYIDGLDKAFKVYYIY